MGFAGLERDLVAGLNLAVMRAQNPGTGRWTTQDPLSFAAGDANLYRYVGNDVEDSSDPYGLQGPGQQKPGEPTTLLPVPLTDLPPGWEWGPGGVLIPPPYNYNYPDLTPNRPPPNQPVKPQPPGVKNPVGSTIRCPDDARKYIKAKRLVPIRRRPGWFTDPQHPNHSPEYVPQTTYPPRQKWRPGFLPAAPRPKPIA